MCDWSCGSFLAEPKEADDQNQRKLATRRKAEPHQVWRTSLFPIVAASSAIGSPTPKAKNPAESHQIKPNQTESSDQQGPQMTQIPQTEISASLPSVTSVARLFFWSKLLKREFADSYTATIYQSATCGSVKPNQT
jgi:hypothetical protein